MGIASPYSNAEFSTSKLRADCNVRDMHRKILECTVVFSKSTILTTLSPTEPVQVFIGLMLLIDIYVKRSLVGSQKKFIRISMFW